MLVPQFRLRSGARIIFSGMDSEPMAGRHDIDIVWVDADPEEEITMQSYGTSTPRLGKLPPRPSKPKPHPKQPKGK